MTDPPLGSSEGQTESCGAETRGGPQVEFGGAWCSPLPRSSCHAERVRPGNRKETVAVSTMTKNDGISIFIYKAVHVTSPF